MQILWCDLSKATEADRERAPWLFSTQCPGAHAWINEGLEHTKWGIEPQPSIGCSEVTVSAWLDFFDQKIQEKKAKAVATGEPDFVRQFWEVRKCINNDGDCKVSKLITVQQEAHDLAKSTAAQYPGDLIEVYKCVFVGAYTAEVKITEHK